MGARANRERDLDLRARAIEAQRVRVAGTQIEEVAAQLRDDPHVAAHGQDAVPGDEPCRRRSLLVHGPDHRPPQALLDAGPATVPLRPAVGQQHVDDERVVGEEHHADGDDDPEERRLAKGHLITGTGDQSSGAW